MSDSTIDTTVPRYDPLPVNIPEIVRLFFIGLASGIVGWLLYLAISKYFIVPVFCRSAEAFAICGNGGTIAWVAAHIIVSVAAVAVLARIGVYRPLLVVLAVLIALWSTHGWLAYFPWYAALLWHSVLFGIAFALFGFVARMTNLVLVILLTVALVVMARLMMLWA